MKFQVLLLLSLGTLCDALFVLIRQDKKKCFYIEQPESTPMAFNYNVLDADDTISAELYRGTTGNVESRIKHKTLKGSGHIDYETETDGYHLLCFSQTTPLGHPTRLELAINFGHDAEFYEKLAKEQNFEPINLEIRKINDDMNLILSEADYQKHKEVEFHEDTESMNRAALWFPMVQIGILLAAGIFQVQHLKGFFKSNKTV